MAAKPPVYARVHTGHNAYREYGRMIEGAGVRMLDKLGVQGARNARKYMTRRATGKTAGSIRWSRSGKVVNVTVGTLAGAVHEFGRGTGAKGGPIPALGFLRRGIGEALDGSTGILKREVAKRQVRPRGKA